MHNPIGMDLPEAQEGGVRWIRTMTGRVSSGISADSGAGRSAANSAPPCEGEPEARTGGLRVADWELTVARR